MQLRSAGSRLHGLGLAMAGPQCQYHVRMCSGVALSNLHLHDIDSIIPAVLVDCRPVIILLFLFSANTAVHFYFSEVSCVYDVLSAEESLILPPRRAREVGPIH